MGTSTMRRSAVSSLTVQHGPIVYIAGTELSLSPDGLFLLYTQAEEEKSDLVLVENFP